MARGAKAAPETHRAEADGQRGLAALGKRWSSKQIIAGSSRGCSAGARGCQLLEEGSARKTAVLYSSGVLWCSAAVAAA